MSRLTLATDMVFGDDLAAREMAAVTGDVTCGYTAKLAITVDPSAVEAPGGPPPGGPPPGPTPSASESTAAESA
jgi:hypothetical protein